MQWWETALGILAGLVAVYSVLLLGLWFYARSHPETVGMRDALRLLPDDADIYENLLNVLDHHKDLESSEAFKTARLLLAQLADRNFTLGFQLLKDGKAEFVRFPHETLVDWRL